MDIYVLGDAKRLISDSSTGRKFLSRRGRWISDVTPGRHLVDKTSCQKLTEDLALQKGKNEPVESMDVVPGQPREAPVVDQRSQCYREQRYVQSP